jgi:hypothetical protein
MRIKYFTLVGLTLLLTMGLMFQAEAASDQRKGSASAEELLIPVGARATALGGANIATVTGTDAIYWNPAGLGNTDKTAEVMFSQMQYIADIGISYAALGVQTGIGTFGFSFKSLNFGDIVETTEASPEGTGATFSPTFFTLGATYARDLTDNISAGVNIKMIHEKILSTTANTVAFDLGVQYRTSAGILLGVTMKNFGPGLQYDGQNLEKLVNIPGTEPQAPARRLQIPAQKSELPSLFEIGLAYELNATDDFRTTVVGNFRNQNFGNDELMAGLEVAFQEMFFVRGSYSHGLNAQDDELGGKSYIWGPAFGFGINYPIARNFTLGIDYAYRTAEYFDANNIFCLTIGF